MITRRKALVAYAVTPGAALLHSSNAEAVIPILGIAIRILIGNALRMAIKAAVPMALSTATRRFLVGVAIAYGISEAHAAIIAQKAEDSGAETIARAGHAHDVLLSFTNSTSDDVHLRSAMLELINLETGALEQSEPISFLRLRAKSTTELPFTVKRFESQGLKQLRLTSKGQILASGAKFYGAA